MQIKGTFLDEISHDIPHQNWGERSGTPISDTCTGPVSST